MFPQQTLKEPLHGGRPLLLRMVLVVDARPQRFNRARVKERFQIDIPVEQFVDLCDNFDRLQRIAAELKEIVADADPVNAKHCAPNARQSVLGRSAWLYD